MEYVVQILLKNKWHQGEGRKNLSLALLDARKAVEEHKTHVQILHGGRVIWDSKRQR
jgi:anion-transporting  ArsA/GET3 family ATPase